MFGHAIHTHSQHSLWETTASHTLTTSCVQPPKHTHLCTFSIHVGEETELSHPIGVVGLLEVTQHLKGRQHPPSSHHPFTAPHTHLQSFTVQDEDLRIASIQCQQGIRVPLPWQRLEGAPFTTCTCTHTGTQTHTLMPLCLLRIVTHLRHAPSFPSHRDTVLAAASKHVNPHIHHGH